MEAFLTLTVMFSRWIPTSHMTHHICALIACELHVSDAVLKNFIMPLNFSKKSEHCPPCPIKNGSKSELRTSLVEQWLRIRLPMQGTQVRALVREDPTCCGATRPMSHDY